MKEDKIWTVKFKRGDFLAGQMEVRTSALLYPFINRVQRSSPVKLEAIVQMRYKLKGE